MIQGVGGNRQAAAKKIRNDIQAAERGGEEDAAVDFVIPVFREIGDGLDAAHARADEVDFFGAVLGEGTVDHGVDVVADVQRIQPPVIGQIIDPGGAVALRGGLDDAFFRAGAAAGDEPFGIIRNAQRETVKPQFDGGAAVRFACQVAHQALRIAERLVDRDIQAAAKQAFAGGFEQRAGDAFGVDVPDGRGLRGRAVSGIKRTEIYAADEDKGIGLPCRVRHLFSGFGRNGRRQESGEQA